MGMLDVLPSVYVASESAMHFSKCPVGGESCAWLAKLIYNLRKHFNNNFFFFFQLVKYNILLSSTLNDPISLHCPSLIQSVCLLLITFSLKMAVYVHLFICTVQKGHMKILGCFLKPLHNSLSCDSRSQQMMTQHTVHYAKNASALLQQANCSVG